MIHQQIHAKALEVFGRFKGSIYEVIEMLQLVDAHKTFREYECTSLYDYAVSVHGLSEDVATNYIAVARKAAEVPALQMELQNSSISITKARKLCSVITIDNHEDWLELARTLTNSELQREVAGVNPKEEVSERLTYVTRERLKLLVGVSEEFKTKLKRAQDLVSNSTRSAASFEQTLEAALDLFLEKRDPVQKAQRYAVMNSSAERAARSAGAATRNAALRPVSKRINIETTSRRMPMAAKTNHQRNLRDQGRCTHHDSKKIRCKITRWLQVHHLKPVAHGGDNNLGNLTTLCHYHHQLQHVHQHQATMQ